MDPSMGPFMDAIGMLILFYLNLIGAKWIWSYLIGEGGGATSKLKENHYGGMGIC